MELVKDISRRANHIKKQETCQSRFIFDKKKEKCTPLVRDVDNRGAYACVTTGVCGKSLHHPPNFIVYLKLF